LSIQHKKIAIFSVEVYCVDVRRPLQPGEQLQLRPWQPAPSPKLLWPRAQQQRVPQFLPALARPSPPPLLVHTSGMLLEYKNYQNKVSDFLAKE
jgi:hypothetical protein